MAQEDVAPIRVGLLGAGTVGSQTARLLVEQKDELAARIGRPIELTGVACLDPAETDPFPWIDKAIVTTDTMSVATNSDIVIELIGGTGVARKFVLAAIESGASVVTANKALLAKYGPEIYAAAEAKGVDIYFEASVGGAIPFLKPLRESLVGDKVTSMLGIVNGTTNYILDEMTTKGLDFDDVLKDAQAKGYAEADPTFDIEGTDSAHKLMLLSAIAFGVPVDMTKVHIEGITHLEAKDIKFAEELGYRIKLLGITKYTDYGIELRVHPALVPTRRLLANVEGAMNAVVVKGDAAESSLYYGKGAGSEPTGSAVVADLIDIARTAEVAVSERPRMPTTTHNPKAKSFADFGDTVCSYYLRIPVEDKPGVLAEIARILADNKISIESLIQKEAPLEDASTEIILLTHSTREADIQRAIRTMQQLANVRGAIVLLRKEELQ